MDISSKFIVSGEVQYLPGGFNELSKLIEESTGKNKKLRIKLGIDPTSTDLHLGHTVCLHYLRRFQELGHTPVLIIGGFTAMVGDPSGRNEARPPLSYEQVQKNAETYLNQVSKILDTSPSKLEVVNNYDWLGKLSSAEILKLAHLVTINQLIGKEAFGNRIDKGEPLYLHEVLYPILQGYDSVAIKADVEIGGIDQTYNVLFGRHMQKHFSQKEQLAIFLPLLIGLDGTKKMSKSFGNYIALNDPPGEVFGKTMSLPDELIIHYFKLVTDLSAAEIKAYEEDLKNGKNPRDVKVQLAKKLVSQLHSLTDAEVAHENFVKQFQKSEIPDDVEEFSLKESIKVTDLMLMAKLVPSKGEAKRLIEGGGVKLKSEKVNDPNFLITDAHKDSVLQIGKRKFVKIV